MSQIDWNALSEEELAGLLKNAGKALEDRKLSARKEGLDKIREIAASIGVQVTFGKADEKPAGRRGGKVATKYADPSNPKHKWSGRGMKPKWLRGLLDQGHRLEEFLV